MGGRCVLLHAASVVVVASGRLVGADGTAVRAVIVPCSLRLLRKLSFNDKYSIYFGGSPANNGDSEFCRLLWTTNVSVGHRLGFVERNVHAKALFV